jgi:hypothetical protein
MMAPPTTNIQQCHLWIESEELNSPPSESSFFLSSAASPRKPGMTKPKMLVVDPPNSPKTTDIFGRIRAIPKADPAIEAVKTK